MIRIFVRLFEFVAEIILGLFYQTVTKFTDRTQIERIRRVGLSLILNVNRRQRSSLVHTNFDKTIDIVIALIGISIHLKRLPLERLTNARR
jgi:hypothetical protein